MKPSPSENRVIIGCGVLAAALVVAPVVVVALLLAGTPSRGAALVFCSCLAAGLSINIARVIRNGEGYWVGPFRGWRRPYYRRSEDPGWFWANIAFHIAWAAMGTMLVWRMLGG